MLGLRGAFVHWTCGLAACSSLVSLVSLVSLSLVAAQASIASAQALPIDVERFSPATGPASYVGVEATRTPGPLRYNLLLLSGYEGGSVDLPADAASDVMQVRSRVAGYLGGELGLGGRFAVGAALPAFPYQKLRLAPSASGDDSASFALGDAVLRARYRFLGVSAEERDAPQDGPGLALGVGAALPTHTGEALSGEPKPRTELSLLADFELLGAGVAANLGWRHRFEGVVIARATHAALRLHDEMLFGAALKLPLPPAPMVTTLLELRGATDFRSAFATHLELDLGARVTLGAFALGLVGGLGFGSGIGTPDGRVLLGVAFSPLDSDGDHDGVEDGGDQCPFLAEDRDSFQDQDGCPDPDNDNDLIPDLDDLCPSVAAEEGLDEDEDGCTDAKKPSAK